MLGLIADNLAMTTPPRGAYRTKRPIVDVASRSRGLGVVRFNVGVELGKDLLFE